MSDIFIKLETWSCREFLGGRSSFCVVNVLGVRGGDRGIVRARGVAGSGIVTGFSAMEVAAFSDAFDAFDGSKF